MITKITQANAEKYTVRFAQAMRDLIEYEKNKAVSESDYVPPYPYDENGEPIEPIDSIEQYFRYLPYLLEIGSATDKYTKLHAAGRRYTILPIDEGIFDINANTRMIEVPDEFKNGISVQGDELAEVLYFRIDRFYDATDLDTTDIYILWKAADGTTGVSTPWVIDIESQPNKIIFGWPISSAITETAGTIEFAVRFYKTDGSTDFSKLLYSFATTTQTAKILSSLDFTLGDGTYITEYGIESKISSRIASSETQTVGQGKAEEPKYLYNAKEDAADAKVGDSEDPTAKYAWYDEENKITYIDLTQLELIPGQDEAPDTTRQYEGLHVYAISTDAGLISYKWTYLDIDTGEGTTNAAGSDGDDASGAKLSIIHTLTNDETPIPGKTYYVPTADNSGYLPFDLDSLGEDSEGKPYTPKSKGLYERFSELKVYKVGRYYATAYNKKTRANDATLDSELFIVPRPIVPVITDPNNLNPDGKNYILNKGGKAGNTVTLRVKPDNTETENHTHKGKLSYEWYHRSEKTNSQTGAEVPYAKIADAPNSNELTLVFDANKEAQEVEGYYKVKVTNEKNGESVSIESKEARLSYPAEAPEYSYPIPDREGRVSVPFYNKENLPNLVKIVIKPAWRDQWNISDDITYQWYQTEDPYPDMAEYEINPETGEPIIIPDGTDRMCSEEVDGYPSNTSKFVPNAPGIYYCVITNIKNGTEAVTISPAFFVV